MRVAEADADGIGAGMTIGGLLLPLENMPIHFKAMDGWAQLGSGLS